MTEAMVDLIMATFSSKEDMKGSSVYGVLKMWPAHREQFNYHATAPNKVDCQPVMYNDPKAIQQAIDKVPLGKAVIDLAAFKAKAKIDKALL